MRAAAALLWLAAAAAAGTERDQDFEFVDNAEVLSGGEAVHARKPRPYVYDPNNALCAAVTCAPRELCVVYRGERALCVQRRRTGTGQGRESAAAAAGEGAVGEGEGEDDVFYDTSDRDDNDDDDLDDVDVRPEHCVGCGGRGGARAGGGSFLCGSDNRTYSSLCRLDLHNCVRRARPPVTLACRGFCPCMPRAPPPAPYRPPRRPKHARKHDKYRQYAHEVSRRHRIEMTHNEAEQDKPRADPETTSCSLESMASRLLDWFSVLMEQARASPHPDHGSFPAGCLPEVRWMFSHLDTDGDGLLSADNLYALRHDDRERCLRPFLSTCGSGVDDDVIDNTVGEAGAGSAGGVSRAQWCGCLRRAARPCTQLARAHPLRQPGQYVPACDARGYYLPRQCHPALRVCWCVDRHGQERAGSRTRGRPRCAPVPPPSPPEEEPEVRTLPPVGAGGTGSAAGGAPADDEDAGGSGDAELAYQ